MTTPTTAAGRALRQWLIDWGAFGEDNTATLDRNILAIEAEARTGTFDRCAEWRDFGLDLAEWVDGVLEACQCCGAISDAGENHDAECWQPRLRALLNADQR